MNWTLRKHGESLEKAAASFVRKLIPHYQKIWASFVGHKGDGTMADAIIISEAHNLIRKKFGEHHYTVLESAFFMYRLTQDEVKMETIKKFEDYRRLNNSLIAFYAYAGRMVDNLTSCFHIMGLPPEDKNKCIDSIIALYNARNNYLHGKKIPFVLNKMGGFSMSDISYKGKRYNQKLWEKHQKGKQTPIPLSMKEALEKSLPLVDDLLEELYVLVSTFRREHKINLDSPENQYKSSDEIYNQKLTPGINLNASGVCAIKPYGDIDPFAKSFINPNKK